MKLIRYASPRSSAAEAFDRLFDLGSANFGRFGSLFDEIFESQSNQAQIPVDFYEDDASYYLRVELPGVKKDEVDLQLEDGVLILKQAKTKNSESCQSQSCFARSVSVPDGVEVEEVSARFEDGVLTVSLPKQEARKPRQIKVK